MVNTETDSFVFHTGTDDINIYIYQELKQINNDMDFARK